jgi:hypothetical protein
MFQVARERSGPTAVDSTRMMSTYGLQTFRYLATLAVRGFGDDE